MFKFLKNNLGYFLAWFLAILPIVIWLFIKPLSGRFVSSGDIFRSLGQITGLFGMALFSVNFILSARFKFLDKVFNGLNRVYVKHHLIGIFSFCLLLFHPVFLIIQYLFISLAAAFAFILPNSLYVDLGKIALTIFILLMVFTFYWKLKYQNWKNTHKFLGIVLVLGIFHMVFVTSDISNNVLLKYYMIGLSGLGVISYFYGTVLKIYKKKEYKYKLEKVVKINDSVVELTLIPLSEKIKFLAGQFVFLRMEIDGILSESHPFSITSHPGNGDLSLGIKTLGDYTSMVYLSKPGVICKIEGPFGVFSFVKAKSKKQIWIAGGIGITPFLSMARQIGTGGNEMNQYKVDLFYSVKNENETAFKDELSQISAKNNNFRFHQHFSDKEGYISAEYVFNKSGDILEADIFLCGPADFMKSLRDQFIKLGFNNNKIHSEEFNF
ncbi:MAG: ferric reductase-like transmembrane domain-containing protein [Patescibacteria group bacterium]